MRKHFLILMLLTLLPFSAWAEEVTLLTTAPQARNYDGTAPTITVKATNDGDALNGTWTTEDGVLTEGDNPLPTAAAGTYTWTQTDGDATATFTIIKKQIVYYLTGKTYAVGDAPDVTNHYSLAVGEFVEGDDLEKYASFEFFSTGNDKLDLDDNGRFTTVKTYNITALRIVEKPVHQNYDFRFTSTAAIVVTKKNINNFVYNDVEDQTYTGSQITFANAPAIYASAADRDADEPIALNPDEYDVTYGDNLNVAYDNNHQVVNGGTIIYKAKDNSNYEGTLTIPFKIQPRELVAVTVDELPSMTYAFGEARIPVLTNKVHGEDADGNLYTLATTDFTVNYGEEANATNVNAGNAVGEISATYGNFTFANNADVANVTFVIDPKDLGDTDITVTPEHTSYSYTAAQIKPNFGVTWKIGQTNNNIAAYTEANWTDNANVEVGKGYVTVVPKEVGENDPQNYTGSKTVAFDIIPTDLVTANVTITLQKENPEYDANAQNPGEQWIAATYQYEGRDIKPGTKVNDKLVDGRLLVTKGQTVLKEGVDYEIVADKYGADVIIGETEYKGDNTNASEIENTKGTVTIKGLGNYGAIDALSDPITKSAVFDIAKRTLTFTAKPVSTTFGVAPVFDYESDAVDDLGGQITYENVQVAEYTNNAWGNWSNYNGELTALEVTAATPIAGSKKYQYEPTWVATQVAPAQNPQANVTYSTAAQVAARANYDTANVVYKWGAITINNAKWIIVPDNASKKYKVADAALVQAGKFTYKVYNGSVAPANLVENPAFDQDCAPVIGRATGAQGENVVNGGYVISVLNANGNVAAGVYGEAAHKVAATGYTIECQTAKLTIEPFPITVTANNQTIYYGKKPETGVDAEDMIQIVKNGEQVEGVLPTVTFTPVMYGNQTLINREELGLSLDWVAVGDEDKNSLGEHPNALVPAITNTNYVATYVNGTVTVLQNPVLILNDALATNYTTIKAYDGEEKNVDVTIHNRQQSIGSKTFKWNAKQYNMLVLPFPVTAREISEQLGYAVVYRANKDKATDTDIYFSLAWEVPANEPFAVKIDENAADETVLSFENKTISAPATAYPSVDAGNGFKLVGAYETFTIDETSASKFRFFGDGKHNGIKAGSTATWNVIPFDGYIDLTGNATAPELVTITFEGEDGNGSATAIRSIENSSAKVAGEGWYNLNGMQLENAPAQKGVYIQNGKKVIIK